MARSKKLAAKTKGAMAPVVPEAPKETVAALRVKLAELERNTKAEMFHWQRLFDERNQDNRHLRNSLVEEVKNRIAIEAQLETARALIEQLAIERHEAMGHRTRLERELREAREASVRFQAATS